MIRERIENFPFDVHTYIEAKRAKCTFALREHNQAQRMPGHYKRFLKRYFDRKTQPRQRKFHNQSKVDFFIYFIIMFFLHFIWVVEKDCHWIPTISIVAQLKNEQKTINFWYLIEFLVIK